MRERKIRGVTPSQEAGVSFRRDTRPLTRQLLDGLRSPTSAAVSIACLGGAGFFFPAFALHLALALLRPAIFLLRLPSPCPPAPGRQGFSAGAQTDISASVVVAPPGGPSSWGQPPGRPGHPQAAVWRDSEAGPQVGQEGQLLDPLYRGWVTTFPLAVVAGSSLEY